MIYGTGLKSQIMKELEDVSNEEITSVSTFFQLYRSSCRFNTYRFVFCSGFLPSKSVLESSIADIEKTFFVNATKIVKSCERILNLVPKARIVVIGSESALRGSYNEAYAMSKAALHNYVETKITDTDQQLVCVSPWIIADAGMTLRREDKTRLQSLKQNHPKQRFVTSREIAKLINFLLYVDDGYITGTTIRVHGGRR